MLRSEFAGKVFGVSGRFMNVIEWPNGGGLANQQFVSERRRLDKGTRIKVYLRFDDHCKNGHSSFAITAILYDNKGNDVGGGCCHDDIVKAFPEFAHLIKWHLVSTDGPMHYIANTVYHAGNRDCDGLLEGEESKNPRLMNHYVRFGESPIEHKVSKRLKAFIEDTLANDGELILDKVDHRSDGYDYRPKFQFAGMGCKWHECPFDTAEECRQWIDAITSCKLHWTSRTDKFGKGKARDLAAARSCAVWPDATDDQLCAPRQVLESLLRDRLPALLEEFKATIESIGFIYR